MKTDKETKDFKNNPEITVAVTIIRKLINPN